MCDAQSSRESFCIAETRRQHGLERKPRRTLPCWFRKEKGPRGLAVQPKSREETPKVGTSWRVGTGHDAALHMGVFVLRCNLAPAPPTELWNAVSSGQRPVGEMATLALGPGSAQGKGWAEGRTWTCARANHRCGACSRWPTSLRIFQGRPFGGTFVAAWRSPTRL